MTIAAPMLWGGSSGPGSDPAVAAPYLRFLERYIREHKIARVLDLGCGDMRLARATDWDDAWYTGIDFPHDIRSCRLPAAGLVLLKDVLQHWPNADITAFRSRLAAYPRVLITNCCDPFRTNEDIPFGHCRALDLAAPPFSWPVREVFRWHGDETKAVVEL